jgi:undecaprenyl-diphosphatase
LTAVDATAQPTVTLATPVGASPARTVRRAVRLVVALVVAGSVVDLALTQRAELGSAVLAIGSADWRWLPSLVVASAAIYVMAAVTMVTANRCRLGFRITLAVQMAAAFTNRLAPAGLGGMATNARFLEGQGVGRMDAVSTVTMISAAGAAVHLATVLVVGMALWLGPGGGFHPRLPGLGRPLLVALVLAVLLGSGVIAWRHVAPKARGLWMSLRDNTADLVHRPADLVAVLGGSAGMTCSHTLALVVCLQAYGGGVAVVSIAIVYLGATGVAAAVPTPGGAGAVEALLAAGLIEVGADEQAAIAAVLTYRLATFWLPIVPGVITYRALRRRRVI